MEKIKQRWHQGKATIARAILVFVATVILSMTVFFIATGVFVVATEHPSVLAVVAFMSILGWASATAISED